MSSAAVVTMAQALARSEIADHSLAVRTYGVAEVEARVRHRLDLMSEKTSAVREMANSIAALESRLSLTDWGSLFDVLVDVTEDRTESIIREWAQDDRILKSQQCRAEPPLGRVLSEEDLVRVIVTECVLNEPLVRTAVGMLLEDVGDEWRRGVQYIRDCITPGKSVPWRPAPIGRWVMWGTWVSESLDPFDGLSDDQIEAALGMEPRVGGTLIAMTYRLPLGVKALFPTVIEACASQPWNEYFRPSLATDESGLTFPVPGYGVTAGRNEVVHKPVEVDALVAPLRVLDNWYVPADW